MVMAKLLGGLASVLTVLALVAGFRRIMPFDIFFHDVYFVVTASGFLFLVALISGILAVLYFAISRWRLRPPNKLVGLVSFAIIVVSLIALFATAFLVRNDSPPHYSQLYTLLGVLYVFLLGFVLLAANIVWAFSWTMLSKVRSHLSSR
jgi:amino acid transporter